jgi:hypothetical protein
MLALDNVDQSTSPDPAWPNRIKTALLKTLRDLVHEASAPMGPTNPAIAGLIPHAANGTTTTTTTTTIPPPAPINVDTDTEDEAWTVPKTRNRRKTTFAQVAAAGGLVPEAARPRPPVTNKPAEAKRPSPNRPADNRLFLRLAEDHVLRNLTATEIRLHLIDIWGLPYGAIRSAQTVRSGWALTSGMGDEIIAKANTHGFLVERNTHSVSYFVTGVPRHLKTHSGIAPTQTLLPQEVESSAGQKATHIAISKRDDGTSSLASYIVSFATKPRHGFRLFNSDPARELKYKPRISQCERCWGYHNTRDHIGRSKCRTCGKTHTDMSSECQEAQSCANCRGPHDPAITDCPLRPKIRNGTVVRATKEQAQAARRLGQMASKEGARGRTPTLTAPTTAAPTTAASTTAASTTAAPTTAASTTAAPTAAAPTTAAPTTAVPTDAAIDLAMEDIPSPPPRRASAPPRNRTLSPSSVLASQSAKTARIQRIRKPSQKSLLSAISSTREC